MEVNGDQQLRLLWFCPQSKDIQVRWI